MGGGSSKDGAGRVAHERRDAEPDDAAER